MGGSQRGTTKGYFLRNICRATNSEQACQGSMEIWVDRGFPHPDMGGICRTCICSPGSSPRTWAAEGAGTRVRRGEAGEGFKLAEGAEEVAEMDMLGVATYSPVVANPQEV